MNLTCGTLFASLRAQLPMWLIVLGALCLFKLCRIYYNYRKRTKRAW